MKHYICFRLGSGRCSEFAKQYIGIEQCAIYHSVNATDKNRVYIQQL